MQRHRLDNGQGPKITYVSSKNPRNIKKKNRSNTVTNSIKTRKKFFKKRKRCGFDSWVGKILWRRAWQPTPVFLPGESHGQRSLVSFSPQGHKESEKTKAT